MKADINIQQLSDEELIHRIVKSNDTHLFAVLYDRYSRIVYNKCLGFANSPDEAQDLTHDIFIKLFVKLRTFKGNSKFSTWLYSFVYNFCVNYVNRDKHRRNRSIENNDINDESYEEVDENALFELRSDKLAKALDLIDPNDKMILLLKYQDDLSIADIQAVLEVGASAVKMRLKRAREKVVHVYNTLS
ncbi:MAG: RNA polymerase subunit sigma-70 [Flavobacteriaceae bacterium]|nr:MAG: RNA polymerase subunit sigma-70 [Flavobacteriaceae bacterium]